MPAGKSSGGGVKSARDVNSYQPPQGPSNIDNPATPGLHGVVYKCGSQGPDSTRGRESGMPGIGGDKKAQGSQR